MCPCIFVHFFARVPLIPNPNPNAINERARSTYKRNYIPALRTDEVTTKRGDSVHYDRDTCAAIQDKIVAHFYSLN